MSQAAQLFDQHSANGNVSSGSKQQAINAAAQMAMKLISGSSGSAGGGGSGIAGLLMGGGSGGGGGSSQIMSLVSKLMWRKSHVLSGLSVRTSFSIRDISIYSLS